MGYGSRRYHKRTFKPRRETRPTYDEEPWWYKIVRDEAVPWAAKHLSHWWYQEDRGSPSGAIHHPAGAREAR